MHILQKAEAEVQWFVNMHVPTRVAWNVIWLGHLLLVLTFIYRLKLSKPKEYIFGLVGTSNNFEILMFIFVINEHGQRGKHNPRNNNEVCHHGTDHEECCLPEYKMTW